MPATQQDIANRLNLSRSLVGGVLSNHPSLRVSKETRRRILQAATELGYRPNALASNLRRGKTGVVTLAYRSDPAEGQGLGLGAVMTALAAGVCGLGQELHIRSFESQDSLLVGMREIASRSLCDAIVLWVEHGGELAAELLESLGFPFIIKGRHEERHPNWLQADFDHEAMMLHAVEHLAARGHERIAYIGPDNIEDYAYFQQKGFVNAMVGLGRSHERWMATVAEGPENVDRIVDQWLSLPEDRQPTAVVIGAGMAAWEGVEVALARRGRRLGVSAGDFAAVGGRIAEPLLFGDAFAYDQVELSEISSSIIEMLGGLLKADTPSMPPVARIRPKLRRQPSLRLPLGSFESYRGPWWPISTEANHETIS